MKKKYKIILITIFVLLLFLLVIVGNFYLNKRDNIKRYFDIRIPSNSKFISYEDTGKLGHIKAVVKVNELEMKEILEHVKKHYSKIVDDVSKEESYSRFKRESFGIEKEKVIEMYESVVSRRKIRWIVKSAYRYIYLIKGDEKEYYICLYTGK